MKINTKKDRRDRIMLRQRKRIAGTAERPRLRERRAPADPQRAVAEFLDLDGLLAIVV